jgi:hypothetical protein
MEIWLDLLLCCKNGGRSIEGRIARPEYESVWSVDVINFQPDPAASGSTGFQVTSFGVSLSSGIFIPKLMKVKRD